MIDKIVMVCIAAILIAWLFTCIGCATPAPWLEPIYATEDRYK